MTGSIVAAMVAGTKPRFDPSRYAPERFGARGEDLSWLKEKISGIVSAGYRKATLAAH